MDVSINLLQAICRTNRTYDEGISELARRLGQSPQNFGKKLKRETITLEELKAIADVMNVKFEQAFILPDGNEIKTRN